MCAYVAVSMWYDPKSSTLFSIIVVAAFALVSTAVVKVEVWMSYWIMLGALALLSTIAVIIIALKYVGVLDFLKTFLT